MDADKREWTPMSAGGWKPSLDASDADRIVSHRGKVREIVERRFWRALEAQGKALLPSDALEDDLALMTCGLDSLGFATLVVQLEEAFGFDPFSQMERLVFPRTFGELVSLYECSVSS